MTEALDSQRELFSFRGGTHYLNCAYMGPLPVPVQEEGVRAIGLKADPTRIRAPDFFTHSAGLRDRFSRLINEPDPTRIAIHPAVSYGVATAARNASVRRGQNIVLLHEQFPGNVYSWRRKASESGAELRTVMPPGSPGRGAEWSERIVAAIDSATAVVTVPTVHWTDGTRVDLAAIGNRAREVGALFLVDGTQSVGAVPFDVQEVCPDALFVAGYKWLLGPYSIGLTYLGPSFGEGVPLEETWIGRVNSEDFQGLVDYQDAYQPGSIRYDVGERANFILVPMQSRALDLILEWRPARIAEYCRALTRDLLQEAGELGFGVEDEAWRSPHLFGLYMPDGIELKTLQKALAEREIFVSLRGSAMRVAPNVYNDASDVGALIEALRAARS